MIDNTTHLGDALAYEDCLPLSWRLSGTEPSPAYFSGLNDKNEEIIKSILILEKHHYESADEDTDRNAIDLARIDFKVNLLLDLMVQVYSKELDIPPETDVSLRSSQLQWCSDQVHQQGEYLFVDLYLSRRYPRPLTLYGRVYGVEVQEQNGYRINLDLDQVSPSVQDLLERFIFLKHRRMVASVRSEHNL